MPPTTANTRSFVNMSALLTLRHRSDGFSKWLCESLLVKPMASPFRIQTARGMNYAILRTQTSSLDDHPLVLSRGNVCTTSDSQPPISNKITAKYQARQGSTHNMISIRGTQRERNCISLSASSNADRALKQSSFTTAAQKLSSLTAFLTEYKWLENATHVKFELDLLRYMDD